MGSVDSLKYRDHKRQEIILSVDLGKARDFTAFAVCEARPKKITSFVGKDRQMMELEVLNVQRLPLGTDYTKVAKAVYDLYHDKRLWLQERINHAVVRPELLVDAGGVGDPVCDDLEKYMGLRPIRYKLVRGTSRTIRHKVYNWSVPRSYMFSMLEARFLVTGSSSTRASTWLESLSTSSRTYSSSKTKRPATFASHTAKVSMMTSLSV